jgi:hypothetical protein
VAEAAARALPRLLGAGAAVRGQGALFVGLLALLVLFILYPLARVLAAAVTSPEGLTLRYFVTFWQRSAPSSSRRW